MPVLRPRVLALVVAVFAVVGACDFPAHEGVKLDGPMDIPPRVQFQFMSSVADATTAELPVRLVLSRVSTMPASVTYTVTGGSATPDQDFHIAAGTTGTIEFAPGETQKDLAITILHTKLEHPDQTIDLVLNSPVNADLGDITSHHVTISAIALPRVQFAQPTSTGDENVAQGFVLSMNKTAATDIVVNYAVAGTAAATDSQANPLDHGLGTSGSITIPAGQLSVMLDPQIVNDIFDEDDETIDVTISTQSDAVVGAVNEHVHTIVDDDGPPTVSFGTPTSTVVEGAGMALVPVTLTPQSGKIVTVDFATVAGGSAVAADFSVVGTSLTFMPGETSKTIVVMIANDTLDEDDETVPLALSNAQNATIGGGTHVLTIQDDDDPPTVSFAAATSSVSESAGTKPVVVNLSAASSKDVSFSFSLSGTATVGPTNDYTVPAQTFVIPAGMMSATFNVTVNNDLLDEDDETVIFTLTSVTNATAGVITSHTLTILDDDPQPTVRFNPGTPDISAFEGDSGTTTFSYQVVLSAKSGRQVTVGVDISGDADAADFSIQAGDIPVVFAPGQQVKTIHVIVNGDTDRNNGENPDDKIIMTLLTAVNATNTADNQVRTHTIVNDD